MPDPTAPTAAFELEAMAYYGAAVDLALRHACYPRGAEMLNLAIERCETARQQVDAAQGYPSEWAPLPERIGVLNG